MIELGTKVKFNWIAKKVSNHVDYNLLTKEQWKELDDNEFIEVERIEFKEMKYTLTGLVIGKRKMKRNTKLEHFDNDYGAGLKAMKYDTVDVYLVATSMHKTYKVPVDLVEVQYDPIKN